ncbi:MAG: ATP-dependent RecD-like DNA helicase [bacterium]|jgi:exodeoxyribonuclease V alpha subunit|nr:ATP-dependent RecD-like DNA helicase [bacterium]
MRKQKNKTIQKLMDLGVPKALAFRAYYAYGEEAVTAVKCDPYQLVQGENRAAWQEIDQLACTLGFAGTSPERYDGAFRFVLGSSTNEGHVFLPQLELFKQVSRLIGIEDESAYYETLDRLQEDDQVVIPASQTSDERAVYLQRLYQAERQTARFLHRSYHAASPLALQAPSDTEMEKIESELGITLAPAQREAIASSLTHKIVILTGGPGTGKTTIIKGVIRLWHKKKARILLAAPTGRAAKRLAESTGKSAKTIHRLLEYRLDTHAFGRDGTHPLKADLLVVDESSMIDIELMACLLDALPLSCHLVFVGDVNQLPAVGPGYVLHDLIQSGQFKTICLTEIYRQAAGSLISLNAQRINQGEYPEITGLGVEQGQDFYFIERSTPLKVREAMLEMILERIPKQFGFDPKTEIQVLCPMIKYDLGVEKMNETLQAQINPSSHPFNAPFYAVSIGDKVMQTRNDYNKEVFNGDMGFVTDIDPKGMTLVIDFEGREIPYTWNELEDTTLAYAITVHKSQGSEYPAVVIPVSRQHYPMLQRNLLYTAVSRGKKLVVLVGSWSALQTAVNNNRISRRNTGLKQMLQDFFQNRGGK